MSITVYTTAPDEKSAETLAKEIVVAKLGSCCNFWPVRTIYSWKGELSARVRFHHIDSQVHLGETGSIRLRIRQRRTSISESAQARR